MKEFCLAAFDSTHHALKFEKTMKEHEVKINVIPVPREITANCGLSVMYAVKDKEQVTNIVQEKGLMVKGFYNVIDHNGKKEYHEYV